jgi:hypothetical protein
MDLCCQNYSRDFELYTLCFEKFLCFSVINCRPLWDMVQAMSGVRNEASSSHSASTLHFFSPFSNPAKEAYEVFGSHRTRDGC